VSDLLKSSGALIDAYRRSPTHCLYCSGVAATKEHPLPEAIGGRLWARVLCATHNGIVNTAADEPLNRNFAPYMTMLQVPRQRGGAGAEFVAKDDVGNPVVIVREGFVKEQPLDVLEHDDEGRIKRASGALDYLDRLPPDAFSRTGSNLVLATIRETPANFKVASDDSLSGGILKMALHFFTGFVCDVPMAVARELLPYIRGERDATGTYVRTPFLRNELFPESWPPRHEITCYPRDDCTLVTILLFGAYAYTCRLPFIMGRKGGVRYRQVLTENYPQFFDDIGHEAALDWEDRPSRYDGQAYFAPIQARIERIYHRGIEQAVRARCERAAKHAANESHNYGDCWERYRMALQLEACFSAEDIDRLIMIARQLIREGKEVWEVPVRVADAA
jgi:hypothetical protein